MTLETVFSSSFPDKIKARPHLMLLGFFFLGSLHYLENHNGGVGLEVPNNVVSWIVISLIIGVGLFRIATQEKFIYSRMTAWLVVCFILLSIPTFYPGSTLINESPVHLGLLGGLLFYIAVQQFRPDVNQLNLVLAMILGCALIEAAVGWHRYLGISWIDWKMDGPGSAIPYGAITQRNVLSTLMVTGLTVSALLLDPGARKGFPDVFSKIGSYILVISPVILIPLVILLKSRAGWVGGAVCLVLVLPHVWILRKALLVKLWTGALLLGLLIVPAMEQVSEDAEVVAAEKLNLTGPRSFFYEQVFDLGLEKPLLGHGIGSFESEYNLFSAQGYADGDYDSPGHMNLSHPHNEIFYWWIEGGIVPLFGMLLAAFVVLKNILNCGNTQKTLMLLALFFPITLHTQTEMPFYLSVSHWIIFLILILLVDVETQNYLEKNTSVKLLPLVLAFAIPLVVGVFMITTLQSGRLLNRVERDLGVEVSILESITNPVVWQDRLMWDMNFGLLALAVYQNRPELAVNYIEWANEIIKRKPRAGYYQFLVIAYKVIGDDRQAQLVQQEAEFRFPGKEFNFDLDAFRGVENKNIEDVQLNMIEE